MAKNTERLPVTHASATRWDGERYTLGFATTELGARRILGRWLRKPVRRAMVVHLGHQRGPIVWEAA